MILRHGRSENFIGRPSFIEDLEFMINGLVAVYIKFLLTAAVVYRAYSLIITTNLFKWIAP